MLHIKNPCGWALFPKKDYYNCFTWHGMEVLLVMIHCRQADAQK